MLNTVKPAAAASEVVQVGDLTINLKTKDVSVGERPVALRPKELDFILMLARKKDQAVSKDTLIDALYGTNITNVQIMGDLICHLRGTLAAASGGKEYIQTVRGKGYKLCAPT